jgi:hypothetical protein
MSDTKKRMKKVIILLCVTLILLSCKKEGEQPIIKGKLVYRSCATIVVQILDSNYYSAAQDTWKESTSKQEYQHVFAVSNQCSFPNSIAIGQEFKFQIVSEDPKNKDCVLCALWDNPPQKSHLIKVISNGN